MSELTNALEREISKLKEELKSLLSLSLDNVSKEMNRLSALVDRMDTNIHRIEINTMQETTKVRGEIEEIYREIDSIKKFSSVEKLEGIMQNSDIGLSNRIKSVEDSQKVKWATLEKERKTEAEEFAVVKDNMKTIRNFLWAILTLVLGLVGGSAWVFIVNGGLRQP